MNAIKKESALPDAIKQTTEDWFEDLIGDLRVKQLAYSSNAVSKEQKELYESLATSEVKTHEKLSEMSREYYFKALINDFLADLIRDRKLEKPRKLAMDIRGHKVLMWFVIPNDDWNSEKTIYLSEASMNAKYEESGYHVSTFIVEEEDCLDIPAHYHLVIE